MSGAQKGDYNFHKLSLLHHKGDVYITRKMKLYMDVLRDMFGNSNLEVVYHSSVLERLDRGVPHLDMLFAILNSYLQAALKKIKIYNRSGKLIIFRFISVTSQFHQAKNQLKLFPDNEQRRGVCVHRTFGAYKELFEKMRDLITASCVG